jgi:hypothetical protein
MVVSAWDIRETMHQHGVERAVTNALFAATALNEQTVDIVKIATGITKHLPEPRQRALILSYVARLLEDNGEAEKALNLLSLTLDNARLAGRDSVLEVLANAADTLATVDEGELLTRICREVEAIEGWFGSR